MYICSENDHTAIESYLMVEGELANGDRCIFLNLQLDEENDAAVIICSNKEKRAINICPAYTLEEGAEIYMIRNNLTKEEFKNLLFEKIKQNAINSLKQNKILEDIYNELDFCEECEIS